MDIDNPASPTSSFPRPSKTSGDDGGPDTGPSSRTSPLGELEDLAGAGRSRGRRDATSGRTNAVSPQSVLTGIFTEFSARRKQEKVAAWMYLQTALAENAGILCPHAVSLKDLIAAEANIEDMLKGQQGDAGKSPQEYLEEWLSPTESTQ